MGFFDLFKKKKEETKKENVQVASSNQHKMEDDNILSEQFKVFVTITGERNNEICDKFVGKGIVDFSNNAFDENTLSELTFDELCHVHNVIGLFGKQVAPQIREQAILYKRFIRKKLLGRISTIPVYTLYSKVTNLPFAFQDSSFLLFSKKEIAEQAIQKIDYDWIEIHEIKPETFDSALGEYFCTGYQRVNINGQNVVELKDVYEIKPIEFYGNVCIESCARMIDYKQNYAMNYSRATKENRNLTDEENMKLNRQSYGASMSLLKNTLLLPCETENNMPKTFFVPSVSFEDGRKFIGLFTDQGAVDGYFKKSTECLAFPNLIRDQYKEFKDDASISGIIINPYREEYIMTKEMLKQLFHDILAE